LNVVSTALPLQFVHLPKTFQFWQQQPTHFKCELLTRQDNLDPTPATFTWSILSPSEALDDLDDFINGLDAEDDFSNKNHQNTFVNKLNAVLGQVNAGDITSICDAIDKLKDDILPKTDGEKPPPDWITDPTAQQSAEAQINAIIAALLKEASDLDGCP